MEQVPERARGSVWAREAGKRRPALTREAIVEAAMAIADTEGLAAVSMRRVAAELGARTMTLYSHIERKEDLLDLMFDQVAHESCVTARLPGGWREATEVIARATRAASLRHPWVVDLAGRRPKAGPNGLRHVEQSLAALSGLEVDDEVKWRILIAVDDYTLGHVVREVVELDTFRRGRDVAEEREVSLPSYLTELLAGGEYPNLAPVLTGGLRPADDNFERGLKWLLDGIAAELPLS
ncbi:TetR/AcrR family transcriptional regulator C-terminal domain-containing protein [Sphaerisporangium dianthi]|uniref:TetR/AcrR family transcriptional regulator C-terminal domain-containing protein n=1 Tax=Sphaerisporangium dianthi TaxID=1436120 RepID=A0ABV9CGY3_9ACTN